MQTSRDSWSWVQVRMHMRRARRRSADCGGGGWAAVELNVTRAMLNPYSVLEMARLRKRNAPTAA